MTTFLAHRILTFSPSRRCGERGSARLRIRRQSGNVFAETALVLIPFFALLLGIIDFGTAIFIRSTLQEAVAAGVRYAITFQNMSGYGMDDSIRLTVQGAALGFLGSTATPNSAITVKYYNPSNGLDTPVTGASGNQPGNVVEVSANYTWYWFSNLSGTWTPRSTTPLSIVTYSSDRLGSLPPGQSPPAR
jgi:Flp pilus assembly protein TadG